MLAFVGRRLTGVAADRCINIERLTNITLVVYFVRITSVHRVYKRDASA